MAIRINPNWGNIKKHAMHIREDEHIECVNDNIDEQEGQIWEKIRI